MSWKNKAEEVLARRVSEGTLAGAVGARWDRNGELQLVSVGFRDAEARLAMSSDTRFRIASMTKPITSVAALVMMEEGRFELDDSVHRWAPELDDLRVLRSVDGPLEDTVPLQRPVTFRDLLTHRAGFTLGPVQRTPLRKAYEALGGDIDSHLTPDEWVSTLATLPLVRQPGGPLHYSLATDLLGIVLTRIDRASLQDVLFRRVFSRLEMTRTGFTVPSAERHTCAALYGVDASGKRVRRLTCPGNSTLPERPADMTFESGGQGLWSTAEDYVRFARLFVQEGAPLLSPETARLMGSNALNDRERAESDVVGFRLFREGHGFGLGVAVVTEPARGGSTLVGGNLGSIGWPGGFGGWWRADPLEGSVQVFFCHRLLEFEQFNQGVGLDVYEAILEFQSL